MRLDPLTRWRRLDANARVGLRALIVGGGIIALTVVLVIAGGFPLRNSDLTLIVCGVASAIVGAAVSLALPVAKADSGGLCPNCGHDLGGSHARCPKCGWQPPDAPREDH